MVRLTHESGCSDVERGLPDEVAQRSAEDLDEQRRPDNMGNEALFRAAIRWDASSVRRGFETSPEEGGMGSLCTRGTAGPRVRSGRGWVDHTGEKHRTSHPRHPRVEKKSVWRSV